MMSLSTMPGVLACGASARTDRLGTWIRSPAGFIFGSGSNFVMLASRTPGLVGVWLCVGVLSARVERQGGGVVASAVLFDLVEAGEQCGHGGRPVAVVPGASGGDEFDVAAAHGGGGVVD